MGPNVDASPSSVRNRSLSFNNGACKVRTNAGCGKYTYAISDVVNGHRVVTSSENSDESIEAVASVRGLSLRASD